MNTKEMPLQVKFNTAKTICYEDTDAEHTISVVKILDMYSCPTCGEIVYSAEITERFGNGKHSARTTFKGRKSNYCPDCGQKLEWGGMLR